MQNQTATLIERRVTSSHVRLIINPETRPPLFFFKSGSNAVPLAHRFRKGREMLNFQNAPLEAAAAAQAEKKARINSVPVRNARVGHRSL